MRRGIIIALTLIAPVVSGARLLATDIVNTQDTTRELVATLERLAPIKDTHLVMDNGVPHFCFSFERPHPDAFKLLRQAVNQFQGEFQWSLVIRNGETCLIGLGTKPTFYSSSQPATREPITESTQIADRLIPELGKLTRFLQSWFDREPLPLSTSDQNFERGVYDTWIVEDHLENFAHRIVAGHLGPREKRILFGITLSEIEAICSDVLGIQPSETASGDTRTQKFQLLARINDPWDDAWYKPSEIESLKQEVQRATLISANPLARKGLSKLEEMCDIATKAQGGLYFLAN